MLKDLAKRQEGVSSIILALSLTALLGVGALVLDGGCYLLTQTRISAAVDAAALAGAAALIDGPSTAYLATTDYAETNGLASSEYVVSVSESLGIVRVNATKDVSFGLARVLGKNKGMVTATAEAKVGAIASAKGVVPLAVEQQEFNFGWQYTLKEGGGSGYCGNYGALALGGTGASNYSYNLAHGYSSTLSIGDQVTTETGNMSIPTRKGIENRIDECNHIPSCTFSDFDPDCSKVITLIIVDSLDLTGRESCTIVGFAAFFLEGVGGTGNDNEIYGRFAKMIESGEISSSESYGLYGVKLTR